MRNPPYALFLALPLGFLSQRTGADPVDLEDAWTKERWSASSRVLLRPGTCLSTRWANSNVHSPRAGPISVLQRGTPYFAGAALLMCVLKPRLFIPFGAVLFVWIVTRKRYRIVAGAVAAIT
jgi:hypothetical protein